MISLVVPETSIKTVCDKDDRYEIDQKLKSVDSQFSSLRREINNINVRLAYTSARNSKYVRNISEQVLNFKEHMTVLREEVKNKEIPEITNIIKESSGNRMKSRGIKMKADLPCLPVNCFQKKIIRRILRDLVRKEFKKIQTKIIQETSLEELNSLLEGVKLSHFDKNINTIKNDNDLQARTTYMQADSSYGKGTLRDEYVEQSNEQMTSKHKMNGQSNINDFTVYSGNEMRYQTRLEEIEHDVETLANGLMALHENMFDIKEIKRQFEIDKEVMENTILMNLRDDNDLLNIKLEYIENQTKIAFRLLHATVKTQTQLQASLQNFNATFKLRNHEIQTDILRLNTQLNILNDTISPNYIDVLSLEDAGAILDIENTVAFVQEIKRAWPNVTVELAHMKRMQKELFDKINDTVERTENFAMDVEMADAGEKQRLADWDPLEKNNTCNDSSQFLFIVLILTVVMFFI